MPVAGRRRRPGQTHCWRKQDSNPRSPVIGIMAFETAARLRRPDSCSAAPETNLLRQARAGSGRPSLYNSEARGCLPPFLYFANATIVMAEFAAHGQQLTLHLFVHLPLKGE
jgi:hypothetical protein